jgi:fluoroquinolone transport system permease protein
MIVLPVAIALAVRWLMPPLMARLSLLIDYDLTPDYVPLMSFVLLTMIPNLVGIVIGFLLLDQRDDGTLAALQVSPLPLGSYLAYRLTIPAALGFLMTVALFPIAGLEGTLPLPLLLAALVAAPTAPAIALFVGGFAANKVQGFALMKAAGVVLWPPMFAWFVDPPWQSLFAVFPAYWAGKLYWTAWSGGAHAWVYLPLGLAYQGGLVYLLLRHFRRVTHAA